MTVAGEVITVHNVAQMLERFQYRFTSERELQDGIQIVLERSCWAFEREYRLTARDRPDFIIYETGVRVAEHDWRRQMLCDWDIGAAPPIRGGAASQEPARTIQGHRPGAGFIAMEIKIKGATADVRRQLWRYAEHEAVRAILLVTTRSLQAAQIPEEMNGKPVRVLCLRTL